MTRKSDARKAPRLCIRLSASDAVRPQRSPLCRNRLAIGVAPAYIDAIESEPLVSVRSSQDESARKPHLRKRPVCCLAGGGDRMGRCFGGGRSGYRFDLPCVGRGNDGHEQFVTRWRVTPTPVRTTTTTTRSARRGGRFRAGSVNSRNLGTRKLKQHPPGGCLLRRAQSGLGSETH
jgi:hypothetical protein